jgi:glycerophosphoryl diester phosphodiesterase
VTVGTAEADRRSGRAGRPLVIAHRGASGSRPENTPSAYALAIEQRSDMIEIDLHRTRDGEIVITHDEDLAGLGGRGEIGDATLESVRALDAGDGQRVPTLDEVLDGFGTRIPFNLELKRGTRIDYPQLEAASVEAVERRGLLDRTLFSSFYDSVLGRLRSRAPRARIGVLVSPRLPDRWLERARAVQAEAVHLHWMLANADTVNAAHAEGLAVHVYTVDAPEAMRRLAELGVDGMFTNHPARLRELLGAAAPRGETGAT